MNTGPGLLKHYHRVRHQSILMTEGLSTEDMTVQSMPDASPTKWHLAHTAWFFETFILQSFIPDYQPFNQHFCHLFNSYYESVGSRHARPERGLLTRPSFQEVVAYREHVDQYMERLLGQDETSIAKLVAVGLHHEMQHQELMLTDLLHVFWHNSMFPAIVDEVQGVATESGPLHNLDEKMLAFDGGLIEIGANNEQTENAFSGFCFDNELPRHKTFLQPFKISDRLVTNGQWLEFIADGGYQQPLLWLSDGWAVCQKQQWQAPLYWLERDGQWFQFCSRGLKPVDPHSPVSHISFYEADAFARWSNKRLPNEAEWELAAQGQAIEGNFLESHQWMAVRESNQPSGPSFYGNLWQWTQSAYSAYPGYKAAPGALGEYNGKFMANQLVLRGGSCATPKAQMRDSYRNFFYPHQRWQFMGLRLAEDV